MYPVYGHLHISLSLPRCRSVTLLQSVYAAKSYDIVLHEPTIRPYDYIHYRELTKDWFIGGFATFQELEDFIETNIKAGKNIFIKDMIFSASNWLLTTKLWERIPKPTVLLWLRNPYHLLRSFYKVVIDMNKDSLTMSLCNYETMLCLRTELKKADFTTYVWDSDALVQDPERYLRSIASVLKIPKFGIVKWDPITAEQMVSQWKESKKKEYVLTWHSDAMGSNGYQVHLPDLRIPRHLPDIPGVVDKNLVQTIYDKSRSSYIELHLDCMLWKTFPNLD